MRLSILLFLSNHVNFNSEVQQWKQVTSLLFTCFKLTCSYKTIILIKEHLFFYEIKTMGNVIQKSISEEVLDKAMYLFWEKGYFNTSIDELIDSTGFNRRAIYHYFGGKRDLFLAMLKRYRQEVTPIFTAPLRNKTNGLSAIEDFFDQFTNLNQSTMPGGCFLIATAADIPSHDIEIAGFIQEFVNELSYLFTNCLASAAENTQLGTLTDIKVIADFLVVNVFGLMALHRAGVTHATFEHHISMVKQFLGTLESEGTP